MENENIKDIIIEDAETSKGSQLKNILILLALLFIILVVSIVITRLILGGDDNTDTAHLRADGTVQEIGESNLTGTVSDGVASATDGTGQAVAIAGAAALAGAAATVALTSKNSDDKSNTETATASSSTVKSPLLAERNTTSKTKVPLRTEESEKSSTKSASTDSSTAPKKATTRASSYTNKQSTYTRPKYVKKKTTTTTRTTTKKSSSRRVTRGYYIKVGAFANPSTAIRSIKAIKLNYKTTKTKKGLTRVLIGPFYSRRDAQNHLSKAKSNVAADAYIAKIK